MTIDVRGALLRTTAIAAFAFCGTGAALAATVSNGTTVNGGGSTLASPTYGAIYGSDGLTFPAACQANGTTTPKNSIFYGAVGSGAGASGFIKNDSTQIGCQGASLADDFGAGDVPIANNNPESPTDAAAFFKSTYGYQMIQVPAFGTPVTVPFNLSGKNANGSLALQDADLCNIFSGKVKDWSLIPASGITTSTNIGVSYRWDSSGTTFIMTNHLAAVCAKPINGITFSGVTKFATLFTGYTSAACGTTTCYTVPAGTFAVDLGAKGSGGIQGAILNNANSIGYLSPDYTKIAAQPTGTSQPPVATVNGICPTNGQVACNGSSKDQVTAALATGSTAGTSATDPNSFGFTIPNPSTGYPIVGYTYLYLSSCYAAKAKVTVMDTWLNSLYNSNGSYAGAYQDILNGGFVPVAGVKSAAKPGSSTFAGIIVADYLAKNAVVPIAYSTGSGAKCTNGR